MNDDHTHEQLLIELAALRTQVAQLTAVEAEQNQVIATLRQNEERYRLMSTHIPDMVSRYTLTGEYLDVTASCRTLLGVEPDELIGHNAYEFIHPDDFAVVRELHREVVDQGLSARLEYRLRNQSNQYIWVETVGHMVGQTDTPYILTVTRDISARKQIELALRTSEERLALAMSGARLGIWDWHVPTGHVTFDPGWSNVLGYAPGELEPHINTWHNLRHPDDNLSSNQALADYFAGLTSLFESEHRLRTKAGEWCWILVRGKVVDRDTSGEPVRLVGTYLDITRRKLAMQRCFELELEKERAKILAKLVQDVKHEAGTSLTVLTMNLYLLKTRYERLSDDIRFAMVEKHVNYIEKLFDALLTMARVDTPDGIWLETCNIDVLVRMVVTRFYVAAREKALNVMCELSPDLPEIQADRRLIDLALAKIMENALRYTPAGGTIALRTSIEHDRVMIEVQDTGIGISEEHLPHIFERFFRVDTARTTRGAGLGLSIAEKIVASHGGHIAVESVLGTGSTFRIYLPLAA